MTLCASLFLNGYSMSLDPVIVEKVVYKQVAVQEVKSIGYTYDVKELDSYCKVDYCARMKP